MTRSGMKRRVESRATRDTPSPISPVTPFCRGGSYSITARETFWYDCLLAPKRRALERSPFRHNERGAKSTPKPRRQGLGLKEPARGTIGERAWCHATRLAFVLL